jgi:hypothetical protein
MKISRFALLSVLLGAVAVLLLMHLIPESISWTLSRRFDLDREANAPTWFSSTLLFSVSLISFLIFLAEDDRPNYLRGNFWLIFSLFYCFLSFDESARVHEIIDNSTSIKWVFVYAPIAAAFFGVCLHYVVIIRKGDTNLRNWVLGGLLLYAAGGLGGEFVSYILAPLPQVWDQVEVIFEEGAEMAGTIFVLIGSLLELTRKRLMVGTKQILIV